MHVRHTEQRRIQPVDVGTRPHLPSGNRTVDHGLDVCTHSGDDTLLQPCSQVGITGHVGQQSWKRALTGFGGDEVDHPPGEGLDVSSQRPGVGEPLFITAVNDQIEYHLRLRLPAPVDRCLGNPRLPGYALDRQRLVPQGSQLFTYGLGKPGVDVGSAPRGGTALLLGVGHGAPPSSHEGMRSPASTLGHRAPSARYCASMRLR